MQFRQKVSQLTELLTNNGRDGAAIKNGGSLEEAVIAHLMAGDRPTEILKKAGLPTSLDFDSDFQKTVRIEVVQLCADEALDHDDAQDMPAGTYEVVVSAALPPDVAAAVALDTFHSEIAISCLDDFEISCFIDNSETEASDDEESYSHCGDAWSGANKID